MLLKSLSIMLVVLAAASISYGNDISFTAGVDRTEIRLDEQLTLELTIAGDAQNLPEPSPPEINGFQVFGAGTSQQISFVNGVIQSSVSHRYMLVPREPGEFMIPPQTISYKGNQYVTEAIKITVAQGSGRQQQPTQQETEPSERRRSSSSESKDFFIETFVDKDTAYVNEQITLTFRYYQGKRLLSSPDYKPPTTTGFWVEDLPPRRDYTKSVGGRTYSVVEIKTALFPTAPGEKVIGKVTVDIKQDDLFNIFDRDPFGFFDRRRRPSAPVHLETDPIRIVALPLPVEGKPADFSGSVGKFNMSTSIDKTEVEVNQPVTVKIKLSGTGNIKTLPEPQTPEMDDFRVFSSGKSENVSKAGYVVGGSKIFELTFVPKKPGNFAIPAITSDFFDPVEGAYKKLTGKSYQISVTGISNEEIAAQVGYPAGRLDLVAKDIRYIMTDVSGTDSRSNLYAHSPVYLLMNLIPLAALAIVFAVRRQRDRLAGDVGYRRLKRAVKMAKVRLSQASGYLRQNEPEEFYTEISRALNEYIGDKFNISAHGLTSRQAEDIFAARGAPEDLRNQYARITATCDEGRFSPSSDSDGYMPQVLKMAEEWIVKFEEKVK
jgi:hypothetical protein